MDLKQKKAEIESKFEAVKKDLIHAEQAQFRAKEELLRLQGEFRLLEEMEKTIPPAKVDPQP